MPWIEKTWAKGQILGLKPDPNTGYRATVWFPYTRHLFNEIREGSLIVVRNFSNSKRAIDGSPDGEPSAQYTEYSVLQIDLVHPWHYAMQGGEGGYPASNSAAATSARRDWIDMDDVNRDDASQVRCEAIPLRIAFRLQSEDMIECPDPDDGTCKLPRPYADRSMPMPGEDTFVLNARMTQAILNGGLDAKVCIDLGKHVVQHKVTVMAELPAMLRLHFGIFGYTGAGKSNLVSTLARRALSRPASRKGEEVFKLVLIDLMDEYTGLLIDQLHAHRSSRLVVVGREALPQAVFEACSAVAISDGSIDEDMQLLIKRASADWAQRLVLPTELKPYTEYYAGGLYRLITEKKVQFWEDSTEQGTEFSVPEPGSLQDKMSRAYGPGSSEKLSSFMERICQIYNAAQQAEPLDRDAHIKELIEQLQLERNQVTTTAARKALEVYSNTLRAALGSRGEIPKNLLIAPWGLAALLNFQLKEEHHTFQPSLTVVIGENETKLADYARKLINKSFEQRRERSILFPTVSFVFDEADVFISSRDSTTRQTGHTGNHTESVSCIQEATTLARRGRKFGLGLGLATQRVRYLDTSIMAQPHTYFISKLPRKSDREAVAEAFAIADETFEQTFAFTVGQWLIASHDATGLKGTPFPVRMSNANDDVRKYLEDFSKKGRI